MRIRVAVLSSILLTLMLFSVISPPKSRAMIPWGWVDEIETCGDNWINGRANCGSDPGCIESVDYAYHHCLMGVYPPSPEEPDFCWPAIAAGNICALQFQGVDNFGLLMECRAKSGIDYCQ
jgi:hypothetical protein